MVQVKSNQLTLLCDSEATSGTALPDDVHHEPITKTRNRIESREAEVFISPYFTHNEKQDLAEALVKIKRNRLVFNTKSKTWENSDETSFYISTTVLSAEEFNTAIRNHWRIENRNHHVRDVTMKEDESRIRTNPHIFEKLRSFAINIFRKNNVKNVSLELFNNCMKLNNVLNYEGVSYN
ncbi:ISAs1 family transposase [Desulfococcaceae bacterium HSG9]|nr:ISAs1 family transposase [Desulfococcaceae bacterium HSG9]